MSKKAFLRPSEKHRLRTMAKIAVLGLFLLPVLAVAPTAGEKQGPVAVLTVIEGEGVQLKTPGVDWKKAAEEDTIETGTILRTDGDSRAEIQFPDNSMLRIDLLSSITINEPETGKKTIDISQGNLWAHLKKLDQGSAFEVKTPQATAGVRGTTFWVESNPQGEDLIGVEEGEVEVTADRQKTRLRKMTRIGVKTGRLGKEAGFDPEKRKKWERFTNNIVREKMEKMRGAVEKYRDMAKDALQMGTGLIEDYRALEKEIRAAARDLEENMKKVDRLTLETERMEKKVRRQMNLGPRMKERQLRESKQEIETLLSESKTLAEQFKQLRERFSSFFESAKEYFKNTKELVAEIQDLKKQREQFSAKSELYRKRREFDPDWPQLKKFHDEVQSRGQELMEKLDIVDKMLSKIAGRAGEKTKTLIESVGELRNYLEENKAAIAESVKKLLVSEKKLNKLLEEVNRELKK